MQGRGQPGWPPALGNPPFFFAVCCPVVSAEMRTFFLARKRKLVDKGERLFKIVEKLRPPYSSIIRDNLAIRPHREPKIISLPLHVDDAYRVNQSLFAIYFELTNLAEPTTANAVAAAATTIKVLFPIVPIPQLPCSTIFFFPLFLLTSFLFLPPDALTQGPPPSPRSPPSFYGASHPTEVTAARPAQTPPHRPLPELLDTLPLSADRRRGTTSRKSSLKYRSPHRSLQTRRSPPKTERPHRHD